MSEDLTTLKQVVEVVKRQAGVIETLTDSLWGTQFAVLALTSTHPDKKALRKSIDQIAGHLKSEMGPEKAAPIIRSMQTTIGVSAGEDDGG